MDDWAAAGIVTDVEDRAIGPSDGGPSDGDSWDGDSWDGERWKRILDRIEQRQVGVGLKFWGPPLWLEVTMTGPDSDAWSTAGFDGGGEPSASWPSWDWQSNEPCLDAMSLADAGADDDELVEVAARYTLENLILNATHEIGEWLRYDARRPFTAHLERPVPSVDDAQSGTGAASDDGQDAPAPVPGDVQGNGLVHVEVSFASTGQHGASQTEPSDASGAAGEELRRRVGAWRFTYRPGTAILFEPDGPVVISTVADGSGRQGRWHSTWSATTLSRVDGSDTDLADAVGRQLHEMLVQVEADQICDAFFVDGRRPWYLDRADLEGPTFVEDLAAQTDRADRLDLADRRAVLVRVQIGDQANNRR